MTNCVVDCGEQEETQEHNHPQISVPSLKALNITESHHGHHIAACLVTPNCTQYNVSAINHGYDLKVSAYIGPWMASVTSGMPSTGFTVAVGSGNFELRYKDDTHSLNVEIPVDSDIMIEEYTQIFSAMGETLRNKITGLTIAHASYEDPNEIPNFMGTMNTLCPAITTLSLQSAYYSSLAMLKLLQQSDLASGWLFPSLRRIDLLVYEAQGGTEEVLKLIQLSNGRQQDRRPALLTHVGLYDGYIHRDRISAMEALGVVVELHDTDVWEVGLRPFATRFS